MNHLWIRNTFARLSWLGAAATLALAGCSSGGEGGDEGTAAAGGRNGMAGTGGTEGPLTCKTRLDCPGKDREDGACVYRTCSKGLCGMEFAPRSAPCSEDGGAFCDGAGRCVECENDQQCPEGYSCEGNQCIPPQCLNQKRDGRESDVDCGGDECPACENGQRCFGPGDCQSRFCEMSGTEGVCAACAKDEDCGDNEYCDLAGGDVCATKKSKGDTCDADNKCATGHCADGFCCSDACDGVCETCSRSGEQGTCLAQTEGTDPDSECGDDVCGAGRACRCNDGIRNGDESDFDCGGPVCEPCGVYEICIQASDCQSGVCRGGSCQRARCGDGVINQEQEQCDGDDLGGADCQSLDAGSGTLLCTNCSYDLSECVRMDAGAEAGVDGGADGGQPDGAADDTGVDDSGSV